MHFCVSFLLCHCSSESVRIAHGAIRSAATANCKEKGRKGKTPHIATRQTIEGDDATLRKEHSHLIRTLIVPRPPMSGAPSTGGAKRKFDSASNGNQPDKRVKRDGPATSASGSTKKPWSKDWKKGSDKKKPLILSRKDRQEKKRERKAAKPNADIIAEANKVRGGEKEP